MENQEEEAVENSIQQEKLKKNFHDFSFDSWLNEDTEKEKFYAHRRSLGHEQEDIDASWKDYNYSGPTAASTRLGRDDDTHDSAMHYPGGIREVDKVDAAEHARKHWSTRKEEEEKKEDEDDTDLLAMQFDASDEQRAWARGLEEEKSVIGGEEEEEEYGEQEADDSESTESAPAIKEDQVAKNES